MATVTFTYPQDVETVYAMATDAEAVRARSTAMGERDIQITTQGDTVKNVRTVDADVPGFAKKVLKPTNTVADIKEWDPETKSAKLTVDVKGAPTEIEGRIRLSPNAEGGTDYRVDFDVRCSIPLIGKKIAQYVEGVTKRGLEQEYEWNKKKLAQG